MAPFYFALISMALIAFAAGVGAEHAQTKMAKYAILVIGSLAIGIEDIAFALTNHAIINFTSNFEVNSVLTVAIIVVITVVGVLIGGYLPRRNRKPK